MGDGAEITAEPEDGGSASGGLGRRALMLGIAAGGAGLAASLVGGQPAFAANGDALRAGQQVDAESSTVLFADSGSFPFGLFAVTDTAFDDYADGFPSQAAVTGYAGNSNSGDVGVAGYGSSYGVFAEGGYGVYGDGTDIGVFGTGGLQGVNGSGSEHGVYGDGDTGVFGTGDTYGVYGDGDTGVFGTTGLAGSYGVQGYVGDGDATGLPSVAGVLGVDNFPAGEVAVAGISHAGTGVMASSESGTALLVEGPSSFEGVTNFSRSGVTAVKKGKASVKVTFTPLSAASLVFATPQGGGETGVYVQGVSLTTGGFLIHLNQATTAALKIAWFIVN